MPILETLRPVLERLRAIDDGTGYVLPRECVKRGIAKACAKAGLRKLTHHESGVDIPTLARWVGHADGGALLAKRYFHLIDAHSKAMARRVTIGVPQAAKEFWEILPA